MTPDVMESFRRGKALDDHRGYERKHKAEPTEDSGLFRLMVMKGVV